MNYQKLTDQQLVQAYKDGNKQAIEVLITRHADKLYSYILMMVKNEDNANDLLQETLIKVIDSIKRGKYVDRGIFLSWMVRIAHNLVIDHFRKSKHLQTVSNDSVDYDLFNSLKFADDNVEDLIINEQTKSELRKLIQMLPDEQREVIMLRHYGGLSFKEIAKLTGVSINTALGRMRYALINLRKIVDKRNINLVK